MKALWTSVGPYYWIGDRINFFRRHFKRIRVGFFWYIHSGGFITESKIGRSRFYCSTKSYRIGNVRTILYTIRLQAVSNLEFYSPIYELRTPVWIELAVFHFMYKINCLTDLCLEDFVFYIAETLIVLRRNQSYSDRYGYARSFLARLNQRWRDSETNQSDWYSSKDRKCDVAMGISQGT